MLICLSLLLTSCAKPCPPPAPMTPPVVYLQEVPEPKFTGRTNADLVYWVIELKAALTKANSDKKAIRDWAARAGAWSTAGQQ